MVVHTQHQVEQVDPGVVLDAMEVLGVLALQGKVMPVPVAVVVVVALAKQVTPTEQVEEVMEANLAFLELQHIMQVVVVEHLIQAVLVIILVD